MSTCMLLLSSGFRNVSSQVSPVNAATPSTLEIVGTLFLTCMMILALICIAWLEISKARERVKELGHLDAMAIYHIHHALCSFFMGGDDIYKLAVNLL